MRSTRTSCRRQPGGESAPGARSSGLLAAVGVSGLLAYLVAARRREIGIRMALGASRSGVVRMITAHGARLALAGIGAGIALAAVAGWWLRALLFGVGPLDPPTFGLVGTALPGVAVAAAAVPATRAASIDATVTLRSE